MSNSRVEIRFTESEREVFAYRETVPVPDFATKNLIVQDGLYQGSPLRLDVSPFLRAPMAAFSSRAIKETIVCGSLQVGKTLFLYACLAWCMVFRHGVKMLAMPNEGSRDRAVGRKLWPLIKGSPLLKRLVYKRKRDTIELKDGTGLELASAESPQQRATITVRDLLVDEEDLFSRTGKSNPLRDFKGRTNSYGDDSKIARACQPKGDESSSIWHGITKEAEVLYCYEIKCPACPHRGLPDIKNIIVPDGETDPRTIRSHKSARYTCPECGYSWTDYIRDLAVGEGEYYPYRWDDRRGFLRIENPPLNWLPYRWDEPCDTPPPKSVGFHIPGILARSVSLSEIAARKIESEASPDPEEKRQFNNDVLGIPYSPVAIQTTSEKILTRKVNWLPARTVPYGSVALTCGIDMQKRGFWYLVRAWMPNLASYVIDYGTLETWDHVSALAFNTWYPVQGTEMAPPDEKGLVLPSLTGELMPIWRACLDTGGTETEGVTSRTEEAYWWVRTNGGGVIHACKGASHSQTAHVRRVIRERMPSGKPIPGGLPLYLLDTTNIKIIDTGRLINEENTQPIYLHRDCDETLAKHLSSEKLVRHGKSFIWEALHNDNHLRDCLMLSSAAADASFTPSLPHYIMQMEQQKRAANMAQSAKPKKRDQAHTGRNGRDQRARSRNDRNGRHR